MYGENFSAFALTNLSAHEPFSYKVHKDYPIRKNIIIYTLKFRGFINVMCFCQYHVISVDLSTF